MYISYKIEKENIFYSLQIYRMRYQFKCGLQWLNSLFFLI